MAIPIAAASAPLKENLAALLPEYATLEANEDGNALILTDTTAGIKRVMKIIQALDTNRLQVKAEHNLNRPLPSRLHLQLLGQPAGLREVVLFQPP